VSVHPPIPDPDGWDWSNPLPPPLCEHGHAWGHGLGARASGGWCLGGIAEYRAALRSLQLEEGGSDPTRKLGATDD
jgi:hypothetical protein